MKISVIAFTIGVVCWGTIGIMTLFSGNYGGQLLYLYITALLAFTTAVITYYE